MNKVVHYKFPLIAKSRQELLLISWICSSLNLVDYFCPAWLIIFLLLRIYLYAVCESTRYKWTSWKREMKVTYTIVVRLIPDIWESIFFSAVLHWWYWPTLGEALLQRIQRNKTKIRAELERIVHGEYCAVTL